MRVSAAALSITGPYKIKIQFYTKNGYDDAVLYCDVLNIFMYIGTRTILEWMLKLFKIERVPDLNGIYVMKLTFYMEGGSFLNIHIWR